MNTNMAKHFVIQFGALIALYASITSLIILVFGIINLTFADAAAYAWENESARAGIRTSIAILVVFFPTYLALTRLSNQNRRKESRGEYVGLTKWLIYITLLIAAGIMLGDLVMLINYFLNGEITTRFLYKVLALLFIVGGAFHYYYLDVKGYFNTRADRSVMFGIGAGIAVFMALVFGYQYIETPSEVRAVRFDQEQVSELQSMQSYIENYHLANQKLPASLAEAYGAIPVPTAPEGRAAYTYSTTSETDYKLCASFTAPSSDVAETYAMAPEKNYNWSHQAGDWCFERIIVPSVELKQAAPVQ